MIKQLLVILIFIVSTNIFAKVQNNKNKVLPPAKLQKDEFTYFDDNKYNNFKITEFENMKLSSSCFKNAKPNCGAYSLSLLKKNPPVPTSEGRFHPASIYCKELGGRPIIALNYKKDEYDFCMAKDKSLVSSWSLYYKHFPKN